MGLLPGIYVAKLYGWELEPASGRHLIRVDLYRNGQPFRSVDFALNGPAPARYRFGPGCRGVVQRYGPPSSKDPRRPHNRRHVWRPGHSEVGSPVL